MTDHRALALLCPFLCSDCQSSVASLPVSCSAHSGESQAHHVKPDNVRPPYCEEAQACHTVTQQPDSSPLPPFQPRERGVGLGHSSCSRRTPQPEVRTGAADKTPRTAKATDGQSQNPRQILTEHLLDPRLCRGLKKQKSWACPVGCAASTHHTGAKARVREAENALGLSRDSPPRANPAVVQRPRGRLALLEAAQPQLCDTGKVNSPFWVYYFFNHKVLMETTATKQSRYENKRS